MLYNDGYHKAKGICYRRNR